MCVLPGCCCCVFQGKSNRRRKQCPYVRVEVSNGRRSKPFTLDSSLVAMFHVDEACSHENVSHSIASQTGLLREVPLESCFSSFVSILLSFPRFLLSSFSLSFHVSIHPTPYPTLTQPPMHIYIYMDSSINIYI